MKSTTLTLDGTRLSLALLAPLAEGLEVELVIDERVRPGVDRARKIVEDHVELGDVVYGLTTGFGRLKNVAIERDDLAKLQKNLILSHSCGVGEPMPREEVRIAQVLRLNGLLRGHSGVRWSMCEALVRLFNKGFVPVVPRKGSVGASGDLAPLAHLAAACLGYGEAYVGEEHLDAGEALRRIGEEPLELGAKEGLALINGTEIMKATGAVAVLHALNCSKAADVILSLTIEALLGSKKPFDDRLAVLKGHAGHRRTSANVRKLLEGSEVMESHVECDRVQDPYSLRCAPQVHGAFKSALQHVTGILEAELNAVTDNPVLFPDTGEVLSAGQFHGQPVSMILDYLTLSLATMANISERRIEQMVNPDLSSLPAFLTPKPGINSGFMIAQVSAAALASENKVLSHPASVDTIPTSAGQEDHVSMGVTAARKARSVCENLERVLAIEWLCGAQARDFNLDVRAGKGASVARRFLRTRVEHLYDDRYMHTDIAVALELLTSGELVRRAEEACGSLEA